MPKHCSRLVLFPLLFAMTLLAGCNGSSSDNATLTLSVADTPVDGATHVMVTFTGVEIHEAGAAQGMNTSGSSGNTVEYNFDTPREIDLMAQQNGNSAVLLDGVKLAAGDYQWIRLKVDASHSSITLSDGSVHALTLPSNDQTGLKLVSGFTVAAGAVVDFTVDFDLRQAVTLAGSDYILRPALRLINNLQVGSVSGSVSNTFMIGGMSVSDPLCSPAVYIYSGDDVTPVDINTTSTIQPVTTASLTLNATTGTYDYKAGFLETGAYTLAVVCAMSDDPGTSDNLTFSATQNAEVTANTDTVIDFP